MSNWHNVLTAELPSSTTQNASFTDLQAMTRPGRKVEEWRYWPLSWLDDALPPVQAPMTAEALAQCVASLGLKENYLVRYRGQYHPELSKLPEGVTAEVLDLAAAPQTLHDFLQAGQPRPSERGINFIKA